MTPSNAAELAQCCKLEVRKPWLPGHDPRLTTFISAAEEAQYKAAAHCSDPSYILTK